MASSEDRSDQPSEFGEAVRRGHEPLTVSVKGLFIGGASILMLVGLSLLLMYWLVIGFDRRDQVAVQDVPLEWTQEDLPPAPAVEPNQAFESEEFRRANQELLDSYGWIDKQKGVARIPVGRAIELLAERGQPALQLGSAPGEDGEQRDPAENRASQGNQP